LERDFGVRVPDGFDVRVSYPDLIHAEDWDEAIEKTRWVPDAILKNYCDTFTIIGNADYVLKRVIELEQLGVTNLYIRGFETYSLPEDTLSAFADIIIPALRQRNSETGRGRQDAHCHS
jgi:5,10-methylenetetrahydromethanopterin reductase